jgi:hypothetical protein
MRIRLTLILGKFTLVGSGTGQGNGLIDGGGSRRSHDGCKDTLDGLHQINGGDGGGGVGGGEYVQLKIKRSKVCSFGEA